MLHTTFRRVREAGACKPSYRLMAKALGGIRGYGQDTPIPLSKVLEICGLADALWALQFTIEDTPEEGRLLEDIAKSAGNWEWLLQQFKELLNTNEEEKFAYIIK